MAPKRAPPRRPPTKQPMTSVKQIHYLNQQQAQMARMFQQQARDRRTHIARSVAMFSLLLLISTYSYKSYGLVVSIAVVVAGWMLGFLEAVQIALAWIVRNAAQPSYDELLRRADIMSQPVKAKETLSGENESLAYGCSSMQGWRRSMEDAHTLLLLDKGGFFGVYDGHSGAATSKYCGEYMFQFVHQTTAFMRGEISQALYDGFIAIDKYLHSLPSFERGGCAAVVLYVDGDDLYCANAGDSRCIMCRNGSVDSLSTDHKPFLPAEQMRIERAGCYVLNRRVNGMLALSRAIGDFMFKNNSQVSWEMQAVTCAPEVRVTHLNRDKDEFAVLACDGIWDMMTSEQVVEFVRPRIQQRVPLGRICEELMNACLSPQPFGLGCDNMSVIIVTFKRGSQGTPSPAAGVTNVGDATQTAASTPSPDSQEGSGNNGNGTKTTAGAAGDALLDHSDAAGNTTASAEDRKSSIDYRTMQVEVSANASKGNLPQSHSPPTQTPLTTDALSSTLTVPTVPRDTVGGIANTHNGAAHRAGSEGKDGLFESAGSGNAMKASTPSPQRAGAVSPDVPKERGLRRRII
ncbi:putative protein phosphatase 2C [Leptomonas pyrrhocoris]|uniref:protein-serine/threonine phosphatase n=1 Tax=Leptomonas pyrrhocoris TaxID=157538 RepID=A0A0M9G8L6_LEPPY|nr:putative protein phosphatase 2C [Leptomonas pyrrhocoris]XP_015663159.1 putative protein phosphatase 2C [Leptomonas pyrrhocoris]KPA84719.1 putative protein phosphatase 2C [Leptomonas pyrrhocoris]KPA84720.1 putative protein phosphatase 2C [Leptomonas pyrrhocoris]|eukprot:XP_015663158.1 putative protein phosphatase 2C [Leptomonas pyrrhocoris]